MKMRKYVKDKLVAALRSGKYKHCIYNLKDGNGCFCPMGVLCYLYRGASWELREGRYYFWGQRCGMPQDRILEWAHISNDDVHTIIMLNDEKTYSFKRMANWIEKNL